MTGTASADVLSTPLDGPSRPKTDDIGQAPANGYWTRAWRRYRRNRVALVAATGAILLALMALLAPWVAPHDPAEQFRQDGLTELAQPVGPSAKFLLGTDGVGRDLLSRVMWGARVSLTVGLLASTGSVIIAVLVGGGAGLLGGQVDFIVMRVVDMMLSIPQFFLMLLMVAIFRPSPVITIVVITIFAWTYPSRIFRSEVVSLKERDYIVAARALGMSTWGIFTRHVLPHLVPLILVYIGLSIPGVIFAEAGLSYLGLGIPPPTPAWGTMVSEGVPYYRSAPWVVLAPGAALMATVLSLNLVSQALRDALDPSLQD